MEKKTSNIASDKSLLVSFGEFVSSVAILAQLVYKHFLRVTSLAINRFLFRFVDPKQCWPSWFSSDPYSAGLFFVRSFSETKT